MFKKDWQTEPEKISSISKKRSRGCLIQIIVNILFVINICTSLQTNARHFHFHDWIKCAWIGLEVCSQSQANHSKWKQCFWWCSRWLPGNYLLKFQLVNTEYMQPLLGIVFIYIHLHSNRKWISRKWKFHKKVSVVLCSWWSKINCKIFVQYVL